MTRYSGPHALLTVSELAGLPPCDETASELAGLPCADETASALGNAVDQDLQIVVDGREADGDSLKGMCDPLGRLGVGDNGSERSTGVGRPARSDLEHGTDSVGFSTNPTVTAAGAGRESSPAVNPEEPA